MVDNGEVAPADLQRVLAAHVTKVTSELDQKLLEFLDQAAV